MRRSSPDWMVRRASAPQLQRCAQSYASGRVLDIGCGDKSKAGILQPFVTEYVGLDHAGSLHGLEHVDIIATAYDIPEPDESFDTVLCTATLEHLEDPQQAVREAFRVLMPGGYAIYTAPLFWHLHEEPRDFYRYTKYGLAHLFSSAGFEIVELLALGGFWVTFGSEWNYYLRRFARGPLVCLVDIFVALNNWLCSILDQGLLRDEKFTWMYLVVARKPPRVY